MDAVVEALAAQQAELTGLLDGLAEADWTVPTRCEGWNVADVVLHLAQSNEMAVESANGHIDALTRRRVEGSGPAESVDHYVATMVEHERGESNKELRRRWSLGADRLLAVLDTMDLSTRVRWMASELSARTLATTRLAEIWIHAGDIAEALNIPVLPTDRLRLIARLAWRTLPYAFDTAGRTMNGPVAFRLESPGGQTWDFLPDEPAVTTIWGSAADLCNVAARRVDPSATSLRGEGPNVADVLALVRTYA
jgi:uncharacterized protein (TIGR03084 family)